MKSIQSFDAFLLAILLAIGFALMQYKLNLGGVLYFFMATLGLFIIRLEVGAKTLGEAFIWLHSHLRIAFYLAFILMVNLVYVGYSFWSGYVGLLEAVGVYLIVSVIFSAIVFIGNFVLRFLLKVFESTR